VILGRAILRRSAAAAAALAAACLAPLPAAAQYCPSYTPSSSVINNCAIEAAPGTNPTLEEWRAIFDLVSRGPAAWGDAGPSVDDIGQGCGKPEPLHKVPARYPCELLMAIAKQESGWNHFCEPTTPPDQIGKPSQTIISFDCGYGVGQVTSGMHDGESPDFDRQRVAADPTYNLATGTRILADKWRATSCVGDNQPSVIEDWYIATWAYNGLAYVNNPNNPNYAADPPRGVWSPEAPHPAPYQEKVFGWMEYAGGPWEPTEPAYPNPGELGDGGMPPAIEEPSCASPTDCATARATHVSSCFQDGGVGGGGGGEGGSSGQGGAGPGGSGAGTGGTTSGGGLDESSAAGGSVDDPPADGCGCRLSPGAERASHAARDSLPWIAVAAFGLACRRTRRRSKS